MELKRRTFFGAGLGGLVALVFPEIANAKSFLPAPKGAVGDAPWQWQAREAKAATDAERAKYMPFLADDFAAAERTYGTHMADVPLSMSVSKGAASTVVAFGTALAGGRIYARHLELTPDGSPMRAATTTFSVSNDMRTMSLYAMGPDSRSALASREAFDASASGLNAVAAATCTPPKYSCRACSEQNTIGILACCGACAWAGSNPWALLSCAIIMCSICASQNCLRWTYACCG